jgi:hypothetical protein
MIVTIQLSMSEIHIASIVGIQRSLDALRNNRDGRYGCDRAPGFDLDIIGCLGELALAKYLDRFWNGAFGDFKAKDVAQRFQVRASSYTGPNAGLILHPDDSDNQPFVKAIVRLPTVSLMGWLNGFDGKQKQFWSELQPGRPCFLIPHQQLQPMEKLRRLTDLHEQIGAAS